jgi:hypothetical protein
MAETLTTEMMIPRIQVFALSADPCGQAKADMNSQIPSARLT